MVIAAIAAVLGEDPNDHTVDSVEVRLPSPRGSSCEGGLILLRGGTPAARIRETLMSVANDLSCSIGHVNEDEQLDLWAGKPSVTVCHERVTAVRDDTLPTSLEVEAPRDSWYHATPGQAESLFQWVRIRLEQTHEHVLDLCAGVGALSFAVLRPGRRILAVDRDHIGLRALQTACAAAGLDELEIRPGKVGTILQKLLAETSRNRPTAALINPMRRPLGDQLRPLPALGVRQIIYLGPSAVPAAKDLSFLESLGFLTREVAAVNLHPATAQMMLTADLRFG